MTTAIRMFPTSGKILSVGSNTKYYWPLNLGFNFLIPSIFGLYTGDILGMLLYAGLVRIVVVHHFTFTINSFAHIWGEQPWSKRNTSRDNWLLSLISFGEGYHNYHHAFQTDYRNGPRWYNYDPSKWLIWSLSLIGVTSKLRRTSVVVAQRRLEAHEGLETQSDAVEVR